MTTTEVWIVIEHRSIVCSMLCHGTISYTGPYAIHKTDAPNNHGENIL